MAQYARAGILHKGVEIYRRWGYVEVVADGMRRGASGISPEGKTKLASQTQKSQ